MVGSLVSYNHFPHNPLPHPHENIFVCPQKDSLCMKRKTIVGIISSNPSRMIWFGRVGFFVGFIKPKAESNWGSGWVFAPIFPLHVGTSYSWLRWMVPCGGYLFPDLSGPMASPEHKL